MNRSYTTVLAGAILAGLLSTDASARQVVADDGRAEARLDFGWLALDPRLSIRDVGVDTNVFNTANATRTDFTATVGEELGSWVRAGRLYVSSTTRAGWIYFQKSAEQRSLDFSQVGRADLALVRLTPHVGGAYERTRQRPNDEIDARVLQLRTRANGGVAMHPGTRLTFDLTYEVRTFDFGTGDRFGDVRFAHELNRREGEATLVTNWAMTPLTTFVVKGARREDDFESADERNSRSFSVMSGLEFKPLALVSGTALVGFRSFSPVRDDLPGFNGLTAAVDLHYIARDRLRLVTTVNRDVDYSFEPNLPYYVTTGVRTEATQALGGSWDVVGRIGLTYMAYQAFDQPGIETAGRRDRSLLVGTGIGRRLGQDLRIGVDVNYVTRGSSVPFREYSGVRAGGSVTYGQ